MSDVLDLEVFELHRCESDFAWSRKVKVSVSSFTLFQFAIHACTVGSVSASK